MLNIGPPEKLVYAYIGKKMNLKLTWIDSHETMKTFLYSTNRCESAVASSHKMHAPKRISKQKRSITGPDIILLLPRVFYFLLELLVPSYVHFQMIHSMHMQEASD